MDCLSFNTLIIDGRWDCRQTKRNPFIQFMLWWSASGIGCGTFTFRYIPESDLWLCDDECMGKNAVLTAIRQWLNENPYRRHRSSRRWTKKLLNYQEIIKNILDGTVDLMVFSEHEHLRG